MHPDDCADSRSPRLVRLLLLSAFGAGLLGLTLTGAGPASAQPTVVVANAAHTVQLDVPVPLRHATRSRPLVRVHVVVAHHKRSVARPTWVRPSYAGIVSPYGIRWGRMHKGIDFGASYGAPIRAVGEGVVVGAGYQASEGGYGQITIIRHAGGVYSAYAHQSRVAVHVGEHVQAGEVIGYVGSTGHSTGPHLHFEIRMAPHGGQVNPSTWLRKHHAL